MESNKELSPEQILAYNEAFAQSLKLLTDANQYQIEGIVRTAISIYRAIASSDAEMPADQTADVKALQEQLKAASQAAPLPAVHVNVDAAIVDNVPHDSPGDDNLRSIMQALSNARNNAVTAQQQLNITAQASLTMGLTKMFGTLTNAS